MYNVILSRGAQPPASLSPQEAVTEFSFLSPVAVASYVRPVLALFLFPPAHCHPLQDVAPSIVVQIRALLSCLLLTQVINFSALKLPFVFVVPQKIVRLTIKFPLFIYV